MMNNLQICVVGVLGCAHLTISQIAIVELQLNNLLSMQQGLGWPHSLHVAEGHEALLKLANELENPESCAVTSPGGVTFDIASPPDSRISRWGESCGVRIANVVGADEGRWRLRATRGNHNVSGWTELFVLKDTANYTAPEISLQDGVTNTDVMLTTLDNSYCLVAQPFSESSLVPGHCRVTLDKATRAVQGNWNVLLGIPGQVQELHVERRVAVEAERLDVGFVHDANANKLHLYCNILHTNKNITFCRFQHTSSSAGFNVIDGLSDGTHSYYGEGFLKKQCGMTIERPSAQDYGTWRCSVGVRQWVGTVLTDQTPMQALITAVSSTGNFRQYVRLESEESRVFVQENAQFTLNCQTTVSLKYCWFQHPNGSQFTPVRKSDQDTPLFWYPDEDSLQTGNCAITFSHATSQDEGSWTCHMGPWDQMGVEITGKVEVKVTGPLASNQRQISAGLGTEVNLYCHSSNGNRPLDYCRFLTPNFVGMIIDSTVTEENAIMGRYYFTPGRNLDYGDCSLTIKSVQEEDIGEWTCAALINQETVEARDTIHIYMAESSTRLSAGIIGMLVGISILAVVLAVYVGYNNRNWIRRRLPGTFSNTEQRTPLDAFSISVTTSSRSSNSSDESLEGISRTNTLNSPL